VTSVRDVVRRGVFEAKTIVARYPSIALPIARRRHGEPVGALTDVVIEGFPRTGTSFAYAAFLMTQTEPVRVAAHVHAPAQVIEGVRRGIPVLVIARDPGETVLSFVVRNAHIPLDRALAAYLRFYEPVLPLRSGLVVGSFPDATSDFGKVTARVNERFGTNFGIFDHTPDNVALVFQQIEEDYRRRLPEGERLEREVARPSKVRDGLKERLRARWDSAEIASARARAERVYRSLTDDPS
jgi:hypothetical protein